MWMLYLFLAPRTSPSLRRRIQRGRRTRMATVAVTRTNHLLLSTTVLEDSLRTRNILGSHLLLLLRLKETTTLSPHLGPSFPHPKKEICLKLTQG
ncbi:wsv109 [White spot syndrome virus]|uniref:Wsv109 n=4 Tax=White spot syndrome virus TaxID=342409 RepID=Q8VB77_WSSVS|nr:wsv109 [Shrimp white spot syndrome virus]AFX59486.1 wsv109 [White spot syndrome virus]AAL33113.1 wsv109 [Shrimp white spot syndrome virus]AAL89033.1 WSSV165 [Shrimp white spot syndrome virus]AWQ60297.1 wsv109 [Shrimp white spot syndrome virus]AWQ60712.1 wsv109 [Shrimp white spot syndrome virus]